MILRRGFFPEEAIAHSNVGTIIKCIFVVARTAHLLSKQIGFESGHTFVISIQLIHRTIIYQQRVVNCHHEEDKGPPRRAAERRLLVDADSSDVPERLIKGARVVVDKVDTAARAPRAVENTWLAGPITALKTIIISPMLLLKRWMDTHRK